MITYDKSMEIFCIIDEFELKKNLLLVADGKKIVIVKPRSKQSSQNTAEQSLFLVIRWHEQSVPVLGIVWEQIAKQLLVLEHRFRFFVIDLHGYFYFLHLSYNLSQWKVIKCIVFQIKVCTSEHPSARETKSLQNILFTLIPLLNEMEFLLNAEVRKWKKIIVKVFGSFG